MSATRDNAKILLEWTKKHNDDLESFEPVWLSSTQIKEVLYCVDVVDRLEDFLTRNDINDPNKTNNSM